MNGASIMPPKTPYIRPCNKTPQVQNPFTLPRSQLLSFNIDEVEESAEIKDFNQMSSLETQESSLSPVRRVIRWGECL